MIQDFINNFALNSYYLNIIFLALALLFVAFSTFFGMVRGLKKTSFRFAWLAVTALILFFVTPFIVELLVTKLDLSLVGLTIPGQTTVTAQDYINYQISSNPQLAGLMDPNGVFYELISKLPYLVLNVIVFVLGFWLLKILLWPIWAIVSAIIIKKKNKQGEKIKKRRMLGMLVGAVMGVFIGSLTLMPITSLINLGAKVEIETAALYISEEDEGNHQGLITRLAGEDISEFIVNFSAGGGTTNIYNYTGFGQLSSAMFSGLTTITVDNKNLSLEKDVISAVIIFDMAMSLAEYDFNTLNQEKLDEELLPAVRTIVNAFFDSSLASIVFDGAAPFVSNDLESEDPLINLPDLGSPELNNTLKQTIIGLTDYTFNDLKNDVMKIIDIIEILNDVDAIFGLEPILSNQTLSESDKVVAVSEILTGSVIRDVINKYFSTKIMEITMPLVLELSTHQAEMLVNENGLFDDPNLADFKDSFLRILENFSSVSNFKGLFIDLSYIYEDAINLYKSYNTDQTINYTAIGDLLNRITNIEIIKDELNELFEMALNYASDLIPQNMPPINNLLNEIKTKDFESIDWAEEVNSLKDLIEFAANSVNIEDISSLLQDTEALGKALNKLYDSQLLGDVINPFIADMIDYFKSELDLQDMEDFESLIDELVSNIRLAEEIDWTVELENIKLLMEMYENGDINDLQNIGKTLDLIVNSNSAILTKPLILEAFEIVIDMFITIEDENIESIITKLKDNLHLINSFENEIVAISNFADYIMDLMNTLSEEGSEIEFVEFGKYLDSFKGGGENESALLSVISKDLTETIFTMVIDSFDSVENEDLIELLENVLENALTAIDNGETYESIFTDLEEVLNEAQSLMELDSSSTDFSITNVASKLDVLANNSLFGLENTQFIADMMFDIIIDQESNNIVQTILTNVKANVKTEVENGRSYASVFGEIETTTDELISLLNTNTANINGTQLGEALDDLSNNNLFKSETSVIIMNEVFNTLIAEETDSDISAILTNIKDNASTMIDDNKTFTEVFEELDEILNEINSIESQKDNMDESNFNGTAFGTSIQTLSEFELFGLDNAKTVSNMVIDSVLQQMQQASDEEENVLIKDQIDIRIQNISDLQSDMESSAVVNFVELFENISLEFSTTYTP